MKQTLILWLDPSQSCRLYDSSFKVLERLVERKLKLNK
jgi:hypothetical protein